MKKLDFEVFESKDISDGYDCDFLETYKFKGNTTNKGKFSYKANICNANEKKYFISEQFFNAKFRLFNNYKMKVKSMLDGNIQVEMKTRGVQGEEQKKKPYGFLFNIGASQDSNKHLFKLKLGSYYQTKSIEHNTFLSNFCCGNGYCLTHLSKWEHNAYKLGGEFIVSYDNLCPCKYNLFAGYFKENWKLAFRFQSQECTQDCCVNGRCGFKPGKYILTGQWKINKQNSISAEIEQDKSKNELMFTTAGTAKLNDKFKLRGKINSDLEIGGNLTYKFNEKILLRFAALLPLKSGFQAFDLKNFELPFPVGFYVKMEI